MITKTHYYYIDHEHTFTKKKMACGIWLPFDSEEIDLENPTCENGCKKAKEEEKENWNEDDIPF